MKIFNMKIFVLRLAKGMYWDEAMLNSEEISYLSVELWLAGDISQSVKQLVEISAKFVPSLHKKAMYPIQPYHY